MNSTAEKCFTVGDIIVHPLFGAGEILDIRHERAGGVTREYYVISTPADRVTAIVPIESAEKVGLRKPITRAEAEQLLQDAQTVELNLSENWNRRYRECQHMMKSGNLLDILRIIKAQLQRIDNQNVLSASERKMMKTAELILYSELMLALACTDTEVDVLVKTALGIPLTTRLL